MCTAALMSCHQESKGGNPHLSYQTKSESSGTPQTQAAAERVIHALEIPGHERGGCNPVHPGKETRALHACITTCCITGPAVQPAHSCLSIIRVQQTRGCGDSQNPGPNPATHEGHASCARVHGRRRHLVLARRAVEWGCLHTSIDSAEFGCVAAHGVPRCKGNRWCKLQCCNVVTKANTPCSV